MRSLHRAVAPCAAAILCVIVIALHAAATHGAVSSYDFTPAPAEVSSEWDVSAWSPSTSAWSAAESSLESELEARHREFSVLAVTGASSSSSSSSSSSTGPASASSSSSSSSGPSVSQSGAASSSTGAPSSGGGDSSSSTGPVGETFANATVRLELRMNSTQIPVPIDVDAEFPRLIRRALHFPNRTGQACYASHRFRIVGAARRLLQADGDEVTVVDVTFVPADAQDENAAVTAETFTEMMKCRDDLAVVPPVTRQQCMEAVAARYGVDPLVDASDPMSLAIGNAVLPGSVTVIDSGRIEAPDDGEDEVLVLGSTRRSNIGYYVELGILGLLIALALTYAAVHRAPEYDENDAPKKYVPEKDVDARMERRTRAFAEENESVVPADEVRVHRSAPPAELELAGVAAMPGTLITSPAGDKVARRPSILTTAASPGRHLAQISPNARAGLPGASTQSPGKREPRRFSIVRSGPSGAAQPATPAASSSIPVNAGEDGLITLGGKTMDYRSVFALKNNVLADRDLPRNRAASQEDDDINLDDDDEQVDDHQDVHFMLHQ